MTDFMPKPSRVKILALIHSGLLVELLVFLGIACYLSFTNIIKQTADPHLANIFLIIIGLLAIIGFVLGSKLAEKKTHEAKERSTVSEKLHDFKIAAILRWAFIELLGVTSIVAFMLTQMQYYIYFTLFFMAVLMSQRPSAERIARALQLNNKERDEMMFE